MSDSVVNMTDIYDDLEHFDFSEELEKLKNEKIKLQKRISDLEKENLSLASKYASLEKKHNIVTENISSLFKTSKAEIERKDKSIADLRRQLDDLAFRRQNKFLPKVPDRAYIDIHNQAGNQIEHKPQNIVSQQQPEAYPQKCIDNNIKLEVVPVNEPQNNKFEEQVSQSLIKISSAQAHAIPMEMQFNPFSSDRIEERRIRLTQLEFEKDYLEVETMMSTENKERQSRQHILSQRNPKRVLSPHSRQSHRFDAKKHRDSRSPNKSSRDRRHSRSPENYYREYKKSRSPYHRKSRSPIRKHSRSPRKRKSKSPIKLSRSSGRRRSRSPLRKKTSPHGNHSPYKKKKYSPHLRRSPCDKYSSSSSSKPNQKDRLIAVNEVGNSKSYSGALLEETLIKNELTKIKNNFNRNQTDINCEDNKDEFRNEHFKTKSVMKKKDNEESNQPENKMTNEILVKDEIMPLNKKHNATDKRSDIEDGEIDSDNEKIMSDIKGVSVDSMNKSVENKNLSINSNSKVFVKKKKAKLEFSFIEEDTSKKDKKVLREVDSKSMKKCISDNIGKLNNIDKRESEVKKISIYKSVATDLLNSNIIDESTDKTDCANKLPNKKVEVFNLKDSKPSDNEVSRNSKHKVKNDISIKIDINKQTKIKMDKHIKEDGIDKKETNKEPCEGVDKNIENNNLVNEMQESKSEKNRDLKNKASKDIKSTLGKDIKEIDSHVINEVIEKIKCDKNKEVHTKFEQIRKKESPGIKRIDKDEINVELNSEIKKKVVEDSHTHMKSETTKKFNPSNKQVDKDRSFEELCMGKFREENNELSIKCINDFNKSVNEKNIINEASKTEICGVKMEENKEIYEKFNQTSQKSGTNISIKNKNESYKEINNEEDNFFSIKMTEEVSLLDEEGKEMNTHLIKEINKKMKSDINTKKNVDVHEEFDRAKREVICEIQKEHKGKSNKESMTEKDREAGNKVCKEVKSDLNKDVKEINKIIRNEVSMKVISDTNKEKNKEVYKKFHQMNKEAGGGNQKEKINENNKELDKEVINKVSKEVKGMLSKDVGDINSHLKNEIINKINFKCNIDESKEVHKKLDRVYRQVSSGIQEEDKDKSHKELNEDIRNKTIILSAEAINEINRDVKHIINVEKSDKRKEEIIKVNKKLNEKVKYPVDENINKNVGKEDCEVNEQFDNGVGEEIKNYIIKDVCRELAKEMNNEIDNTANDEIDQEFKCDINRQPNNETSNDNRHDLRKKVNTKKNKYIESEDETKSLTDKNVKSKVVNKYIKNEDGHINKRSINETRKDVISPVINELNNKISKEDKNPMPENVIHMKIVRRKTIIRK